MTLSSSFVTPSVCYTVGRDVFNPEDSLDSIKYRGAMKKESGGAVCGEVWVAIFIRLLAQVNDLRIRLQPDCSMSWEVVESCIQFM